jgi:type IV secretory pathway TrbF-like protein
MNSIEKQRLSDLVALDDVLQRLEQSYQGELTEGDFERFATLKKQARFMASVVLVERYARDNPLLKQELRISGLEVQL